MDNLNSALTAKGDELMRKFGITTNMPDVGGLQISLLHQWGAFFVADCYLPLLEEGEYWTAERVHPGASFLTEAGMNRLGLSNPFAEGYNYFEFYYHGEKVVVDSQTDEDGFWHNTITRGQCPLLITR